MADRLRVHSLSNMGLSMEPCCVFRPLGDASFLSVELTHDKVMSIEGKEIPKMFLDMPRCENCRVIIRDVSQPCAPPIFIVPLLSEGTLFMGMLAFVREEMSSGLDHFFTENNPDQILGESESEEWA